MNELLKRYPDLKSCSETMEKTIAVIEQRIRCGGTIYLCGNGGSCADCIHISGELLKGFLSKRPLSREDREALGEMGDKLQYGIPAVPLPSLDGVITAFANDVDPSLVYAQLVWAMGKPGDVLIGLSTSGNSENVVQACKAAKAKQMTVIGMTGEKCCKMDEFCDEVIHVPASETYRVQEFHLPVYHHICAELEKRLFEA